MFSKPLSCCISNSSAARARLRHVFLSKRHRSSTTNEAASAVQQWFDKEAARWPVRIGQTPTKGRGLFATRPFHADEVVFAEDPVMAAPKNKTEFCSHCLLNVSRDCLRLPSGQYAMVGPRSMPPASLLMHPGVKIMHDAVVACPDCKREKYCSAKCQEAARPYHETLCTKHQPSMAVVDKLGADFSSRHVPFVARLVALLYGEMKHGVLTVDAETGNSGGSWEFLSMLHFAAPEELDVADWPSELDALAKAFPEDAAPLLTDDMYLRLLGIYTRNSAQLRIQQTYLMPSPSGGAGVTTETGFPTHGAVLPRLGVFVNHDCDANVQLAPVFTMRTEWIAKRDISDDEELSICYVDPSMPSDERRLKIEGRD
eukprot:TRINITY_DN16615_c0_g1_i1.p1 TRINITY_DN16615_c0_g1~~TRINITY_DN16615_c0_g1_i1.p1  ORF type:complete len:371 (-),score=67.25 TRINITY_DN16615_c0_g1_i1:30-1142(-)